MDVQFRPELTKGIPVSNQARAEPLSIKGYCARVKAWEGQMAAHRGSFSKRKIGVVVLIVGSSLVAARGQMPPGGACSRDTFNDVEITATPDFGTFAPNVTGLGHNSPAARHLRKHNNNCNLRADFGATLFFLVALLPSQRRCTGRCGQA